MDSTVMPEMQTLAAAVATHLGPGWKDEPHPEHPRYSAHVIHEDGRQVRLYVDRYATGREAGRIHVTGQQPKPPADIYVESFRINFGHITVAATKSPRQVAGDVSRRLLPDLTAALAAWQAKVQRLCSEEAERTATAHRLADVLAATPTRALTGIESCTWVGPGPTGAADLNSDGPPRRARPSRSMRTAPAST